jgi:hypothetical protein
MRHQHAKALPLRPLPGADERDRQNRQQRYHQCGQPGVGAPTRSLGFGRPALGKQSFSTKKYYEKSEIQINLEVCPD